MIPSKYSYSEVLPIMRPITNSVAVVSFYKENITTEVLEMQRAVFSQFRMPLRQILFEGPGEDSCYHGKAIDQFLRRTTAKTVVLFDVDAVPLSSTAIPILLGNIPGICGAAQQSNHKNVDHPYAGPSCVCFNMSLYHTLANPSFEPDDKSDVGERLTWAAQSHNTPIALLTPIAYEKPGWRLGKVMEFGRSTIYACQNGKPLIFHAFEARKNPDRFVKACRRILNGK